MVELLRTGPTSDQFVVHYLPKIDLGTGEVHSVEALVRWNHHWLTDAHSHPRSCCRRRRPGAPDYARERFDSSLAPLLWSGGFWRVLSRSPAMAEQTTVLGSPRRV